MFYLIMTFIFLADEDNPSKIAKVEIPSSQVAGIVPGSLGVGYPPQSTLGMMQYVILWL